MPNPTSANSLDRFVQVYDDALPAALCQRMIESFHTLARFQRRNGEGVRGGLDDSGWTELDISSLSDAQFQSMLLANMHAHLARYVEAVGLTIPVPLAQRNSELIIKRYRPGGEDRFQPHFDSLGEVSNRYLVFLWYLNDVAEGGETSFVDLGIDVAPKAGRLLMFPPYWMFQHAGRAPVSNDKYILSTYFLF
ncbi:2OG-Fe(II) oxygenase family protein [Lysobacter tyrosinilyticus]